MINMEGGNISRNREVLGQVHLEGDAWGDFQEERTLRMVSKKGVL